MPLTGASAAGSGSGRRSSTWVFSASNAGAAIGAASPANAFRPDRSNSNSLAGTACGSASGIQSDEATGSAAAAGAFCALGALGAFGASASSSDCMRLSAASTATA